MFLPYEYITDPANKDVALCDDCLISSSGHENCDLPECKECLSLVHKLKVRRELATDFVSGTLMLFNPRDSSFDDGEQDSNSEKAYESDQTNDILDNFDGGEIELLFSKNYGEDNKNENGD